MNESLRKIQSELNAPKNLYNSFGKYSYRSCESILEAVKPLLQKYEAEVVLTDEVISVGDRIYVKATAIYTCKDDEVIVTAFAREPQAKKGMDEPQITGTASSYARKYALNGLFLIDDNKDADTDEYHYQQEQKEEPAPLVSEQHVRDLIDYADEMGVSHDAICDRFGIASLEDMDMYQWTKAIKMLEATERKNREVAS